VTAGLVTATGNVTGGNLVTAGLVTATGNVTGGNLVTAGLVTATGNVTGGNLVTAGLVTATGNVTGGNLVTAGSVTATGNISANYFVGNGSQLTGVSNYANANAVALGESGWAGNIIPAANVTYSLGNSTMYWSNLWVANNTIYIGGVPLGMTATGVLTVNGDTVLSNDSNTSISTTGNITADYFFGNGSQLTGMYGNANVVANLAALASNPISTTGNVTAGYVLGNGSQLTDVNAVTVDITNTNGLTTVYYPTFVENRTTGQIARADVDLTYKTDDNLLTVGNVSVTGNVTGNTAGFVIGYRDIPQVSFTANATLAATDAGKHYYSTLATANTLTIANNTSVGWNVGTAITIVNRGTGNMTIAQDTGVSLYLAGNSSAGNRTVTTYGMVTLLNVAANVWMINGTGVS